MAARKAAAAGLITASMKMDQEPSPVAERILKLAIEMIYLLTGELIIRVPQAHFSKADWRTEQKMLEVAHKIIYLLTGEIPIRCQDVAVYLSTEEREYLEEHEELYKGAMMEDQLLLPPLGGSRTKRKRSPSRRPSQDSTQEGHMTPHNYPVYTPERSPCSLYFQDSTQEDHMIPHSYQVYTPERSPCPLYSQDSTQEGHMTPHHYQNEEPSEMKVDFKEEAKKMDVWDDEQFVEEDISQTDHRDTRAESEERFMEDKEETVTVTIGADGQYNSADYAAFSPEGEAEDYDTIMHRLYPSDMSPMRNESPTGKKSFFCSICGKYFPWKSQLLIHEQCHTGEKPYSCSECGKCFTWKSKLAIHKRTHTGEKPYCCAACGKSFSGKSQLATHERLHTGEKPFSCSECGKCFSTKAVLTTHKRLHTGNKPYSCFKCGKCFYQKPDLIKHERIHTGERPYSCTECGKCFSQKSSLIRHKNIHRERP